VLTVNDRGPFARANCWPETPPAAKLLIDQHGQDAILEISIRADELLGQGNLDGGG
jgi:hypothetical protein